MLLRLRNPSRGNARSKKLSRTHQRELNYNCRVLNASLKSVVTSPQRFALARDHKSSFFCRVQTHDLFLRLISSSSRLILSSSRINFIKLANDFQPVIFSNQLNFFLINDFNFLHIVTTITKLFY